MLEKQNTCEWKVGILAELYTMSLVFFVLFFFPASVNAGLQKIMINRQYILQHVSDCRYHTYMLYE